MQLEPDWQVMTVGDGDLSFSHSLFKSLGIKRLTPTVLDTEKALKNKYSDNAIEALENAAIFPLFEFDVTKEALWQQNIKAIYDVVIFQFPLIPAVGSKEAYLAGPSLNVRNRYLLRQFIQFAAQYALSAEGKKLIYITSKEVKPYIDWNIETLVDDKQSIHYLGRQRFSEKPFLQYRMRNVDRDKVIKSTRSYTHIWSLNGNDQQLVNLERRPSFGHKGCDLCCAGPFTTAQEKSAHVASARHQRMTSYDAQWQQLISQEH